MLIYSTTHQNGNISFFGEIHQPITGYWQREAVDFTFLPPQQVGITPNVLRYRAFVTIGARSKASGHTTTNTRELVAPSLVGLQHTIDEYVNGATQACDCARSEASELDIHSIDIPTTAVLQRELVV